MKKKSLWWAALLGATMMCAACSDDSANKSKIPDTTQPPVEQPPVEQPPVEQPPVEQPPVEQPPVEQPPVEQPDPTLTYSLTCAAPTDCNLVLNAKQLGQVRIQLSSLSNEEGAVPTLISNAAVTATMTGTGFTIHGGAASVDLNTDALGQATLLVQAGEEAGSGTVRFVAGNAQNNVDVTFTITVNPPSVEPGEPGEPGDPEDPPVVEPEDVTYTVNLSYQGDKEIRFGEVLYFVDKTCSEIIKDEMTSEEVIDVRGEADSDFKRVSTSVNDLSFEYKVKADDPTVFNVFARGNNAGLGIAYGCVDGLGPDKQNVTVELTNVKETGTVIVDPDEPGDPDDPGDPEDPPIVIPPDPDPDAPVFIYEGTYPLTSQFNALSLLPHAGGTNVAFKDMLLGDWIQFTLDVLSNPAGAVPDIITGQLLPLILNAEWFSKFVNSILPESIAGMLTPEVVASLFNTLGLSLIIENSLNELTSQLTWWDTATGSVKLVNDLVTKFTLRGAFDIPAGAQTDADGKISGINHRYLRVLYNNGNFDKCYVGTTFGEDVDKHIICSIGLDKLDAGASGAVSGRFDATFKDDAKVDIAKHNLNLAYGRLIYGIIMEFVPMIAGMSESAQAPKTLSQLIAYYLGSGIVKFWNDKHPEDPDAQIGEGVNGCAAVGTVASKFLVEKFGENETFGNLIKMFANASTIGSLCEMGIAKLDDFIDGQIDKLSVEGSAVSFESKDCEVYFRENTDPDYSQLTNFGLPQKWGSTLPDKRCDWSVSIATSNPVVIEGKFAAGNESN